MKFSCIVKYFASWSLRQCDVILLSFSFSFSGKQTTAFAAQKPWIQNATLKDNILCGHEMDKEWFVIFSSSAIKSKGCCYKKQCFLLFFVFLVWVCVCGGVWGVCGGMCVCVCFLYETESSPKPSFKVQSFQITIHFAQVQVNIKVVHIST